jgi:predicted Fe-S protein YdhL (DUF1289 family)
MMRAGRAGADEPAGARIESPCVDVCEIHRATGLCLGCRRTIEEIVGWSAMTSAERRRIMAELPARKMPVVEG